MSPLKSRAATLLVAGAAVGQLAGCYGGGARPVATEPMPMDALAVDVAIEPISASEPTTGAAAALDACGITNFNPAQPGRMAANFGIEVVAGMGLVVPGRDAGKYAALGSAPEIQTDDPLWVITTGDAWLSFPLVTGELRNATCVVPDRDWASPRWFATGDVRTSDGAIITPAPLEQPVFRLPPLSK
ncbi:MAG: hypothetical protein HYX57_10120 [Chloroflexi bacterium]|nr:hypothetical protein [Chloroflexota bacterium]